MQKHVNLVDLVKSFPTNIFLQNLASIQKRTSPTKFAHLAEKSENCSISNLSTKLLTAWCSASVALLRVVGIVVVGEYLPSAALVERRAHKSTHPLRPGNPGQRGKIKYESGNCRAFS